MQAVMSKSRTRVIVPMTTVSRAFGIMLSVDCLHLYTIKGVELMNLNEAIYMGRVESWKHNYKAEEVRNKAIKERLIDIHQIRLLKARKVRKPELVERYQSRINYLQKQIELSFEYWGVL